MPVVSWLSAHGEAYDPRPAIKAWSDGGGRTASEELTRQLCHWGGVNSASYAAVAYLVRMMQEHTEPDGRAYCLLASIEDGRRTPGSPPVPIEMKSEYEQAWADLLPMALRDLASVQSEHTIRAVIAVISLAKGQHDLATAALKEGGGMQVSPISNVGIGTDRDQGAVTAKAAAAVEAEAQLKPRSEPIVAAVREQGRLLTVASEQVRREATGLERLVEVATSSANQTERHMMHLVPQAAAVVMTGQAIEQEASGALGEATRASLEGEQVRGSIADLVYSLADVERVVQAIDQTSKQTNLLALNARIEASRFGEAGAGFAVVAGEVKALAQHIANLTRQATAQLDDLRLRTAATSTAIEMIVAALARTRAASDVISTAVRRQGSDVSQIRSGIEAVAAESRMTAEAVAHARSAITVSHDAADLMEDVAADLRGAVSALEADRQNSSS